MEFKFPDSGKTIKIEGISFLTISMLRGWYEQSFGHKPIEPKNPQEADGDVLPTKEQIEQYKLDKQKYDLEFAEWHSEMVNAQWAAQKSYYASCVTDDSVEPEAVEKAVKSVAQFMDLRATLLEGFSDLKVPFEPDLLDKYIYLWHVCITNQGEQVLFQDAIATGSSSTQEVVDQALFRLRSKV